MWILKNFAIQNFLLLTLYSVISFSSEITFEKKLLKIGNKNLFVELADTPEKRMQGLMNRKSLPWNSGMLFVSEKESTQNFWMKNTFVDLSIGFFNKEKILMEIYEVNGLKSASQKEIPTVSSQRPAKFTLEVNKGWFKKNKIKPGEKFILK